jgi:myosin heavy subunit
VADEGSVPREPEREVEIAELETRIKRFNLDIVQPTIRKTAIMEKEVAALRNEVETNSNKLIELSTVANKVEEQVVTVESFREQMSKWDHERRAVQAHVAETLSSMRQDMDNFRYSLERKDSSIHSMQRTMDRLVGELSKVQEGSEALRQHVELRLAQTGKILNGAKTDLECKLIAQETKLNRLSDELWGEETGLARATSQIKTTNDLVMSLSEEMKRMQHDKANVSQLEAVQDDVKNLIHDANYSVSVLKQTVDTMVADVKAHFKTATNTVAAHNASMLSEVRESYQEEMRKSDALRTEVMQFMQETKENVSRIETTVGTSEEGMWGQVKKVSEDVGELSRNRKRDNDNFGLQGQTFKEQISKVSSTSENVAKCLEHLGSIIAVMLKSERVASALSQQENTDRNKVALMGYRDAKGPKTTGKPTKRNVKNSKGGAEADENDGESVISVDNRCLSCSGQAQHVLSGFKMACLQYAPGPVTFSKQLYKREELLDLRQRLLEQALEQLQQGPAGQLADFTGSSNRTNLQRELEAKLKQNTEESDRPSSRDSQLGLKSRALPPLSPGVSSMSTTYEDSSRPVTAGFDSSSRPLTAGLDSRPMTAR